ncbi:MAG: class I SAM-dependent methyltransferase [Proteobacteria bacterium]|nr:class I SAM-dependent methyltransferase [Pseudomonadota bacterium]
MNLPSNPHFRREPAPWIVRFAHLVAAGGHVLDVASGYGRQALFLARAGFRVTAVDRDADALATLAGTGIDTRVADLEDGPWPLAGQRFDGVVVVHYLHRPRCSELVDAVADDGVLLYETFAQGNEAYGRPSNPAFLLAPDELLQRVEGRLRVVAFEQGTVEHYGGTAVVQRIAAVGLARPWPPALAALPDGARGAP